MTDPSPGGHAAGAAAAAGLPSATRRPSGFDERRAPADAATSSGVAGSAASAGRAPAAGSRPAAPATRHPGRRARLVVSRVSPWSVVRVTFLYSLCLFVVLLVAVAVLWSVLNAAGVFDSVKTTAENLTDKPNGGIAEWLSMSRVMLMAVLVGVGNIILLTLLSAIGCLLYNVCSDAVGGIEVTLSERH